MRPYGKQPAPEDAESEINARVTDEDGRKTYAGAYMKYTPRRRTEKPPLDGEKIEEWNGKM